MAGTTEQIAAAKATVDALKAKVADYTARDMPRALINTLMTQLTAASAEYNRLRAAPTVKLGKAGAPAPAMATASPTAMTMPTTEGFPLVPVAIAGGVAILALAGYLYWRANH
jgi:hypothetical protein